MHSKNGTAGFLKRILLKNWKTKNCCSRHNTKSKCDKRIYRATLFYYGLDRETDE